MGARKAGGPQRGGARNHRLSGATSVTPADGQQIPNYESFLPGMVPAFLMQGSGMLSGLPPMSISCRGSDDSHHSHSMQTDLGSALQRMGLLPYPSQTLGTLQLHPDSKRLDTLNQWLDKSYELQQQGHILWVAEQKELQHGSELAIISPPSTHSAPAGILSILASPRSCCGPSPACEILGSPPPNALMLDAAMNHGVHHGIGATPSSLLGTSVHHLLSPLPGNIGLGLGLPTLQPVTCLPSARRRLDLTTQGFGSILCTGFSPTGTSTARALALTHTGLSPSTATARAMGHNHEFAMGHDGLDMGMGFMGGLDDPTFSYGSHLHSHTAGHQNQQPLPGPQDLGLGQHYGQGGTLVSGRGQPLQLRTTNVVANHGGLGSSFAGDTPKFGGDTPKFGQGNGMHGLNSLIPSSPMPFSPLAHQAQDLVLFNFEHPGLHILRPSVEPDGHAELRLTGPDLKRSRLL